MELLSPALTYLEEQPVGEREPRVAFIELTCGTLRALGTPGVAADVEAVCGAPPAPFLAGVKKSNVFNMIRRSVVTR